MLVKICGLTTPAAIEAAIAHGASHIGLVHFEPSPRHLSLADAAALRKMAPPALKVVLLLVNASAERTAQAIQQVRPDILQFHGNETPEWLAFIKKNVGIGVWKALGIRDRQALLNSARFEGAADRLLFDTPAQALPGGNGTRFDWSLLAGHRQLMPWGLAGGLDPANVADAIRATGAPLVDVSSGVESAPGVKDVDKIAQFCKAVRDFD